MTLVPGLMAPGVALAAQHSVGHQQCPSRRHPGGTLPWSMKPQSGLHHGASGAGCIHMQLPRGRHSSTTSRVEGSASRGDLHILSIESTVPSVSVWKTTEYIPSDRGVLVKLQFPHEEFSHGAHLYFTRRTIVWTTAYCNTACNKRAGKRIPFYFQLPVEK